MNTGFWHRLGRIAALATLGLAAGLVRADPNDATRYPYSIPFELGAVEFALGDDITLTSLRGDRPHLEVGGTYLLEGTYTLLSAPKGGISVSNTTREPVSTSIGPNESAAITKGSGVFRFEKQYTHDGWLHVSFNVDRHSYGGIYFGEQGVERTILRTKTWSDFAVARAAAASSPAGPGGPSTGNLAILQYLGEPVRAPADLKPEYEAAGLEVAFRRLAQSAGMKVTTLSVDTAEFPYLVYGTLEGRHRFTAIQSALERMPEYKYGGSFVGSTGESGTYFAINMTPNTEYPPGQFEAAHRRLMVRLEMLGGKARAGGL